MRLRPALFGALAVGLASTMSTTAFAAPRPKPICNLISDPEGDGRSQAVGALSSPSLDVLSADIASGRKTVTGIIRLKSTKPEQTIDMLGVEWNLLFTVSGVRYGFYRTQKSGSNSHGMRAAGNTVPGIAAPQVTGNTITWTAPRSVVTGFKKRGAFATDFIAGTSVFGTNADNSVSDKKYPDMHPSCLRAS